MQFFSKVFFELTMGTQKRVEKTNVVGFSPKKNPHFPYEIICILFCPEKLERGR